MKIDILTLFPDMFKGVLRESILKRAQESGKVKIVVHNLRKWSKDKHKKADDKPYGGGPGMVMTPQPLFDAVETLKAEPSNFKNLKVQPSKSKVIFLTPQGKKLGQAQAKRLAKCKHLILICGHYEGIDERARKRLVTDEISIGDYVLTGGEIPAMALIDSIVRLVPGVLGHKDSAKLDSFSKGALLEHPHYTRPAVFRGMKVPKVLLGGDHKEIENWRRQESIKRTKKRRPELLKEKTK